MSFGSTCNNGPFSAAIAYEVHNNLSRASGIGTTAGNPKLQDQGLTMAGSYTFGG
jgi:hypothetical protein